MTTLTIKDGVMAADTLWTADEFRCGYGSKLRRLKDGSAAGMIGGVAEALTVIRWIEDGFALEPDTQPGKGSVIRLHRDGTATLYADGRQEPIDLEWPFAAGSGRQFAMGAMAMGATAERAVEVGIEFDVFSGGKVETMRVE